MASATMVFRPLPSGENFRRQCSPFDVSGTILTLSASRAICADRPVLARVGKDKGGDVIGVGVNELNVARLVLLQADCPLIACQEDIPRAMARPKFDLQ